MAARRTAAKRGKGSAPEQFEQLLKAAGGGANDRFKLRLFVSGNTVRSVKAIGNLRALCEEMLPGRYDLEVIDIFQQPAVAVKEQIIAAPTLVKIHPVPPKRLIGDLSDRDRVLLGLNLVPEGKDSGKGTQTKTHWANL